MLLFLQSTSRGPSSGMWTSSVAGNPNLSRISLVYHLPALTIYIPTLTWVLTQESLFLWLSLFHDNSFNNWSHHVLLTLLWTQLRILCNLVSRSITHLLALQVSVPFMCGLKLNMGTSLAVQGLRLHASNAEGAGSILGQGTKILHALWPRNQNIKKKQKQYCNKFNKDCKNCLHQKKVFKKIKNNNKTEYNCSGYSHLYLVNMISSSCSADFWPSYQVFGTYLF